MPADREVVREHLVALAALPAMGPARLQRLLEEASAVEAWSWVRAGRRPCPVDLGPRAEGVWEAWVDAARSIEPAALLARHRGAGVDVVIRADPAYPSRLAALGEPPPVLFVRGRPEVLAGPCAAVVGTRRCTRYGFELAQELGRALALGGACVVSGLAVGIDAAAHQGVVASEGVPAGVVGSGLDVVYPARNRRLWQEVAAGGVLLSEAPLGTPPARWRFPSRNRLIAALADVVVVVESHRTGGALGTAELAMELGRPVLAVPGSVRSAASDGVNRLLGEGAAPCTGAVDVLTALGLARAGAPPPTDRRPAPTGPAARVLATLGWEPVSLDGLVEAAGLPVAVAVAAVAELEDTGWILRSGRRIERIGVAP